MELVLFIDQSDEEVVDPDAAANCMHSLAGGFDRLDGQQRVEIAELLRVVASEQRDASSRRRVNDLVHELGLSA
ncbi:hypothetical protein [Stackebrandtia albiflava]|uniref:hypothetical protein n=1 Tax=Stackebrandtia albiflava TaxID=406432 RepID=UPI0011BE78FF|nr:hypothetical protein [Stackebrandtia albiflava]